MNALSVEVVQVRYAADDFAVLRAVTDDGEEVTLTGPLAHVHPGEALEVDGEWREHPQHGRQYHARAVRVRAPVSDAALLAFLSTIKHVGPAHGQWLLDRHGADVLAAIDADPEARLREVPGIGRQRARVAARSWVEARVRRAVRLFLEEHGVPAAAAARIQRALGAASIEDLRADPYALTEVEGIGFATADALARALGVPADDPGRLEAGVLHVLREAEDDGHCLLPRDELLARAASALASPPPPVADAVDRLAAAGRLDVEGDAVADARLAALERGLARKVRELVSAPPAFRLRDPDRPAGPDAPSDAQWAAVTAVLDHRLAILTGLPGTGKTTAMRALVTLLHAHRRKVRLCAPTGKAARRLAETTGADASTIHRLLEYVPGEGFSRDEDDPVPGADVLIVDEASMLSLRLAAALLAAVGPKTHVLLVGDVDQLAPVGAGRVLEDLIDSGEVPTVRLTEIFRQAERSLIIRAAHAMNRGEDPPVRPGEGDLHDFFLIARSGAEAIAAEVLELAAARLPRHYGVDPSEVLVLSPLYRGPAGIDALNEGLRARLNPDGAAIPGSSFRVGDRVMAVRNDYELELMNGERGTLVAHDREDDAAILATDDGRRLRVTSGPLAALRPAFAASVHKAQGSQARIVVTVVHLGHRVMLTRNLVYTALTRASEISVIVGEPAALRFALSRPDARERHTRLARLVAEGAPAAAGRA